MPGAVSVKIKAAKPKGRDDVATIYVKTKPGRAAFFERRPIPHDKFIPVPDTPYIRRLIEHWEDVEVESG